MSLQTIINNSVAITIDRRKVSGYTVSRSGLIKISSIASNVPWQMTVEMHAGMKYSTNRNMLEELDKIDRTQTSTINIGNANPGLAYITSYQGELNSTQLSNITISSANVLNVVMNVSSVSASSGTYVFRKGDYWMPTGAYKYPYTVTADVTRGSGSTITVPISRPFIDQAGYTEVGAGIKVGKDVTWNMLIVTKPSYSVIPYDRIAWDGAFELAEVIED
jgi:hypothetical protein